MVEAVPFAGYDLMAYRRAPVTPTRLVSEGDIVGTGDRAFEVLHLPGHSPGSIALWERSSGSLFSGDAIYDGVIVDNLPGSDVRDVSGDDEAARRAPGRAGLRRPQRADDANANARRRREVSGLSPVSGG